MNISILGSCVTRDAVEFIDNLVCENYIARQSIVSMLSYKPTDDELKELFIGECHRFHRNSIINDIYKKSMEVLTTNAKQVKGIDGAVDSKKDVLIIDLIEERMPLGIFESGAIVTLSQPSKLFSNLNDLVKSRVQPFSREYLELFEKSLDDINVLDKYRVFIHKAYYVDSMEKNGENSTLEKMYEMLLKAIPNSLFIEPNSLLRKENDNHLHGLAPYHYIDEYYLDFIRRLELKLNDNIKTKDSFSLSKV